MPDAGDLIFESAIPLYRKSEGHCRTVDNAGRSVARFFRYLPSRGGFVGLGGVDPGGGGPLGDGTGGNPGTFSGGGFFLHGENTETTAGWFFFLTWAPWGIHTKGRAERARDPRQRHAPGRFD